jgi:hypothetical protein
MQDEIINKVSNSGLITIDPEEFYPADAIALIDIKEQLLEGFLLREKDFREFIKTHSWNQYIGKHVAVFCSNDAIIPRWAWMLVATALQPYAKKIVFGNADELVKTGYDEYIAAMDIEQYRDQRVVIKGCSHKQVPVSAYIALTERLTPVVKSIMYGEPCSTVPVYKRK